MDGFCQDTFSVTVRRGGQDSPGRPSSVCQEAEQEKLAQDQLPAAGVHAADSESQGWSCRGGSFMQDCHCYSKKVCQIDMCVDMGVYMYTQYMIKNLRCTVLFMLPATYLTPTFDKLSLLLIVLLSKTSS